MKETEDEARERYERAAHAMQTGVKMELELGDSSASPKHLRVGVNAAMSGQGGLAALLISKGIFTREEYASAVADQMEAEARSYEIRLSERMGSRITLL